MQIDDIVIGRSDATSKLKLFTDRFCKSLAFYNVFCYNFKRENNMYNMMQ